MALEPLNAYGSFSRAFDIFLLLAWIFVIALMSLFEVSTFAYFSGLAFVVTTVSVRWSLGQALAVLLLVSWIYGAFSRMPTALIFWSLAVVLCALKLILESLHLKQRSSVALLFLLAALGLYALQFIFLNRVSSHATLSLHLLQKVFLASLMEGLSGFVLGPSFLAWIAKR